MQIKILPVGQIAARFLVALAMCSCGGSGGSAASSSSSSNSVAITNQVYQTAYGVSGVRSGSALSVKVVATGGVNNGGRFVDGSGQTLKFTGFNLAGLEYAPIQGQATSTATDWGTQLGTSDGYPNFSYFSTWHANVVRIPLNEASWNANGSGGTCVDVMNFRGQGVNATINPDPKGTYRADVAQAVTAATAAGYYVILDLHWSAPSNYCPCDQDQMANTDNSVRFWQSVATAFKAYPNVMFELFNEPYAYGATDAQLTAGVASSTYYAGGSGGALYQPVAHSYQLAGWNTLISTIRATGASNVILVGTINWCADNTGWLTNVPSDTTAPAGYSGTWTPQIAAAWHTYPKYGATWGTAAYNVINNNGSLTAAQQIIAGGYPVIVTEFGDVNTSVTTSPFVTTWLHQFDTSGVSYVGWAWSPPASVYSNAANQLTANATGTPTNGFGQITYNHFLCYATAANPVACP